MALSLLPGMYCRNAECPGVQRHAKNMAGGVHYECVSGGERHLHLHRPDGHRVRQYQH